MMHVVDAGVMAYRPAWEMQLALHERVLAAQVPEGASASGSAAGAGDLARGALMLVEHPPVITIGRRADAQQHLLASPKLLALRGVEVVETDRGGDITFHGPGQLVAYPIVPLNRYNFNLHTYMRFLEEVVIQTLGGFGVAGLRDPSPVPATGVWVQETKNAKLETQNSAAAEGTRNLKLETRNSSEARLAKICALGIKVRRWVTLHGIALNVTTDLSYFELINPCGLSRPVTSLQRVMGERAPAMATVKRAVAAQFEALLRERGAGVVGA